MRSKAGALLRGNQVQNWTKLFCLDVEILDIQCMLLNEFASGLDFVAHEDSEHLVGCGGIDKRDFDHRSIRRIECGFAELFRIHFTKTLEACDL